MLNSIFHYFKNMENHKRTYDRLSEILEPSSSCWRRQHELEDSKRKSL